MTDTPVPSFARIGDRPERQDARRKTLSQRLPEEEGGTKSPWTRHKFAGFRSESDESLRIFAPVPVALARIRAGQAVRNSGNCSQRFRRVLVAQALPVAQLQQ